ncbi:MAG: GntR family transcriptional regulator [Acidimicrobiaceae bacterium]|jgi:GntR family transcriptional repressor for pyruvate dehydrogenase complex|nr:GntR family transcriptional regulator [Acidimicrobiaceae bacterium]
MAEGFLSNTDVRLAARRRAPRLVDAVVGEIVEIVVSGVIAPGASLPAETDLARQIGVSRLTLREAITALAAKGVLDPQHGRGTFVRPVELWSPLDPVLLAARARLLGEDIGEELLEARRIVEVAAARLAAQRRLASHVSELEQQLGRMRGAAAQRSLEMWVASDVRFHEVLLEAAGNPVVAALFDAIGEVVLDVRRRTSALPERWRRAIAAHERVLQAVEAGDAAAAEEAMAAHLADTEEDMQATRGALRHPAGADGPSHARSFELRQTEAV